GFSGRGTYCPLKLIRPCVAPTQSFLYKVETFFDLFRMPERAVLLLERHKLTPAVHARVAPRIVQQHECQQAQSLGLTRQQFMQSARQANRFSAELSPHQRVARGRTVS